MITATYIGIYFLFKSYKTRTIVIIVLKQNYYFLGFFKL